MTASQAISAQSLRDHRHQRRGHGLPPRPVAVASALPRIDGYRLQRKLGEGRLATVYLAQDGAGNAVALKVARGGSATTAARLAAMAREFAVPAAIRNNHVMRVFDLWSHAGVAVIAMEYLAGGPLGRMLGKAVAPEVALPLLRQAALALDALHGSGFAHGDVKPANLLLRRPGELVLADFGTARRLNLVRASAPAGLVVGTPRYAAPEQTRDGAVGAAADVYSLGVVCYELLCGQPPFPGTTVLEVSCQHLMAPVPRLPAALAPFQPLVDAMLAKQAHRRLPDGRAVLEQIDLSLGAAMAHPAPFGATATRYQR